MPRAGHGSRSGFRRAVRTRDGRLRRTWRLDAPHRHRSRPDRRLRNRGRRPAGRCRAGLLGATRRPETVSVCFFGDGATKIGAFHEAMNNGAGLESAGDLRLRNNLYGGVQPYPPHDALREPRRPRGELFHANRKVDGNDVPVAVYAPAAPAVSARDGVEGPTFMSARPIAIAAIRAPIRPRYRDPAEVEAWLKRIRSALPNLARAAAACPTLTLEAQCPPRLVLVKAAEPCAAASMAVTDAGFRGQDVSSDDSE